MKGYEKGKKVVCIYSHSQGVTRKGQVYVILGIMQCKCGRILLDLGVKNTLLNMQCSDCEKIFESETWWQSAHRFTLLEETEFKQVTYTKIIEEIPMGVN